MKFFQNFTHSFLASVIYKYQGPFCLDILQISFHSAFPLSFVREVSFVAASFLAVVTNILLHISPTIMDIFLIDYLFCLNIWKIARDIFLTCVREGIFFLNIYSLSHFQFFTPEQFSSPYVVHHAGGQLVKWKDSY